MAIVRWDPFRDVAELQNRINRIFDESFGQPRKTDDDLPKNTWRPAVDIYEAENGVVLAVELPGVKKEDVSVEVKDDVLTLKGERPANPDISEDSYYRRERFFGPFKRSFSLHQNIQPDLIKATFKDGVLQIEIPRPMREQPKQVTVNVE
ncbi:MAG: Hsp20/alpha crystallin family protein [Desulfobacterales bacterium]|nr:Hsp20/alpha crystallin family protein [Desulfobacterales bacterium]